MKSKMGEAASSSYCPLDLFSEDRSRIKKAIYDLWDIWSESNGTVNNLKIFVQGKRIVPSDVRRLLYLEATLETTFFLGISLNLERSCSWNVSWGPS